MRVKEWFEGWSTSERVEVSVGEGAKRKEVMETVLDMLRLEYSNRRVVAIWWQPREGG